MNKNNLNFQAKKHKNIHDENESPEYIVKLSQTKTNREISLLYRENKSMIEMITQWWNRITRVYSKTTYDEN